MDIYSEFLGRLESSLQGNQEVSLKEFVDSELAELYQQILTTEQQKSNSLVLPSKFPEVLSKLNNSSLKKQLTLNFYFSHTYVLNLDRRPDRLAAMKQSLKQVGIYNWTRWSALDGNEPPHYDEWCGYRRSRMTYNEKRRYHRKAIGSPGSWAILKSMYLMIKDAMKKRYHSILVLQDDLLFHQNFVSEFLKIPANVPKNWKLLYIGATQHNWNHVEFRPRYYFPMGTADGAFAVGIHHSLYREMLEEISKFDMPFDSGTLKTLQKRYGRQCLILSPNLVIADIRDSDLRRSRDIQAYGKKFRWNIKNYLVPGLAPEKKTKENKPKENKTIARRK